MPARYDRRRSTVLAFDAPDWEPPEAAVIDTNVVAEMMLPDEAEHASCDVVLRRLVDAKTVVVFNRLLELELWEVVYEHALRRIVPGRDRRLRRFDKDVRPEPAVADAGFAVLLPEDATLHTTRRRLGRTRARRRDACGG